MPDSRRACFTLPSQVMFSRISERDPAQAAAFIIGWLVLLSAIAIVIWQAAGLIWRLADLSPTDPSTPPVLGTVQNLPAAKRVDLAGLHLFGQSGMTLPVGGAFDAPETSLDLLLRGTLASDDPKDGIAIVVDSEGDGFYNIGEELPGSATLHEVYTDRVVLVHQGRFETLRLRDEQNPPARNRRPRAQRRPVVGTAAMPGIRSTSVPTGNGQVDWQNVQTSLRIDPAELARQVRVLPYLENGKPVGVRLQAGRDSAIFSRLGLRNTDIITEVNGVPLDNPARSFELLTQLKSQSQFAVRLKRDGRDMTLNIDANQLGN
ncbi:MAG: type II secretion system protein GspC [Lysobacterales bacterium]